MDRDRMRWIPAAALIPALAAAPACSIRRLAINKLGDALAESGATYASDDDPDLVRDALPFALKLIESLLEESPEHRGLLLAAASGFVQYTWAFVQQDADEMEDRDLAGAMRLRERARRLYLRARGYALRGLELAHPGLTEALFRGGDAAGEALAAARPGDIESLYWCAAAWGLSISLGMDDPSALAELPAVEALARRALELDADWGEGSLHELMIVLRGGRSEAMGGSQAEARRHFERALELSGDLRASSRVTFAETVSVRNQDRREFVSLLEDALRVDPDARPEWRLHNLVMMRRARWLLERADILFLE